MFFLMSVLMNLSAESNLFINCLFLYVYDMFSESTKMMAKLLGNMYNINRTYNVL